MAPNTTCPVATPANVNMRSVDAFTMAFHTACRTAADNTSDRARGDNQRQGRALTCLW